MDELTNNDINKYKLKIKTEQAGAFRILIEALKEILTEANFVFDDSGIKLMAMDSTHTILIHMKLEANFQQMNGEQHLKNLLIQLD